MFPLGTVLLPTALLPLQVFEPRYQALVADCLKGENEFGVTLIERGSEVGGGDVRTDVGTMAQILEARETGDGRWLLATAGTRRFRVSEWLDDAPYPRARLEGWPEESTDRDLEPDRSAALELLTRIAQLTERLGGEPSRAQPDVAVDPALASYQIAALAPLGPLDRQQLLCAPGPDARFRFLAELLEERVEDLRLRFELEGGPAAE